MCARHLHRVTQLVDERKQVAVRPVGNAPLEPLDRPLLCCAGASDGWLGLLLVQREDKLDVVFGEGRAVSEAADAAEEQPRDDLKA